MLLAYVLRYDLRQQTIDTNAEVSQREQKLECTLLPHLSHAISCNQQDSLKLTHYRPGTATKPVGKKTCYKCFADILQCRTTAQTVYTESLCDIHGALSSTIRAINVVSVILPLMCPRCQERPDKWGVFSDRDTHEFRFISGLCHQ